MNNIKKKQPHKVAVIMDCGIKDALKMSYIGSTLKHFEKSTKLILFAPKQLKSWAPLLGFDQVYCSLNPLTIKFLCALHNPAHVLDLRVHKQQSQIDNWLKEKAGIDTEKRSYKFFIKAQDYLTYQQELLNEGLVNKKYVCFYNGYKFLEDRLFKNKTWPYEIEFLKKSIQQKDVKTVVFYEGDRPLIHEQQIVYVNILTTRIEKIITLIERASAFVGTDTVLTMIAAIVGTPTSVLQGPSREINMTFPNVKYFKATIPCSPCSYNIQCKDNVCMKVFLPAEVNPL